MKFLLEKYEETQGLIDQVEYKIKELIMVGQGHAISSERLDLARLYIQRDVVLDLIREFEK